MSSTFTSLFQNPSTAIDEHGAWPGLWQQWGEEYHLLCIFSWNKGSLRLEQGSTFTSDMRLHKKSKLSAAIWLLPYLCCRERPCTHHLCKMLRKSWDPLHYYKVKTSISKGLKLFSPLIGRSSSQLFDSVLVSCRCSMCHNLLLSHTGTPLENQSHIS